MMQPGDTVTVETDLRVMPMDRRFSVTAATVLGIVPVLVFIIQPGYVQGLVDLLGLTGSQAGYVASAEMTGYAATVIALSFLSHRLPWWPMLIGFVLVEALGNAACIFGKDPWFLATARFVAGLGAGGLSSLAFTAIGMTRNPDREFGFFIMWILGYGAVGLFGLPSLFDAVGMRGFHMLVVAVTLASLVFVPFMPKAAGSHLEEHHDVPSLPRLGRWAAIVSIFLFFLGCGILWAYISLIGDVRNLGKQAVANALSLSQITGVAGALMAGIVGARFGRKLPLGGSILVCAGSTAAIGMVDAHAALLFASMVCLFNFAWNVAQPVYLSAAAALDNEGRLVPQMVASQSCGLAAGPFVGAVLGGERDVMLLIVVVAALFLCAAVSIALLFRLAGLMAIRGASEGGAQAAIL